MSNHMDLVCCLFLLLSICNGLDISGTPTNVDRELISDNTDTRLDFYPPNNLQLQSEATHFFSHTPDQQQLAIRAPTLKTVGTFVKTLSRKLTQPLLTKRRSRNRGGSFISSSSFGWQDSLREVRSSPRRDGAVRRPPKRELSHIEKFGVAGGYPKQMVHYGPGDIPADVSPSQKQRPSDAELRRQHRQTGERLSKKKQHGIQGGWPRQMVHHSDDDDDEDDTPTGSGSPPLQPAPTSGSGSGSNRRNGERKGPSETGPTEAELRRRYGKDGGFPKSMVLYSDVENK